MNREIISMAWRTLKHRKFIVIACGTLIGLSLVAGFWIGSSITGTLPQVSAATPPNLFCTAGASTGGVVPNCVPKPASFGITLPWEAGRSVYRGSYTYGCCSTGPLSYEDHLGTDSYALDFVIGPDKIEGVPSGGTGGRAGHERDVDAIASGVIVWAGWYTNGTSLGCYGNSVAIEHDYPSNHHYFSFYTHLGSFVLNDQVVPPGQPGQPMTQLIGQSVAQGATIGIEGNSGSGFNYAGSSSCSQFPEHLHFVLYQDAKVADPQANPPIPLQIPLSGNPVVPEPFIGADRQSNSLNTQGNPVSYENLEWFGNQTPLISYHPPPVSPNPAPNPGGEWNPDTTPDLGQVTYNSSLHFDVHVTDTQPIAEVHLTLDYQNAVWSSVSSSSIFAPPQAPTSFPTDHSIWRILADCNGIAKQCTAASGSATWSGTSTDATISYDWYPNREAVSGSIPSPVPYLPPAVPALTYQSNSPTSVCISFDVIDIYGVGNLAPNGTHCGNTNTRNHPAASGIFQPLTDNTTHLVTLNPPVTPQACPPGGTWRGLPYLNEFYTGQTDNSNNCTFSTGNNTLGSLDLASGTNYMEGNITIGTNQTVNIPNGATILGSNGSITDFGTINVQAGATIKIAKGNTYLLVNGGTLNLNGTAAQPILITSAAASPAAGDWLGVSLQANGAAPAGGSMSFVTVSYSGEGVCCLSTKSSILIRDPGTNPTLDHVTVDRSYGNGIEVYNGASPTLSNLSLTNNGITGSGQGAAVLYDTAPSDFSQVSNLSASGNLQDALVVGSGAISGVGTWGNVGLPYNVLGSLNLLSGAQFTFSDGINLLQISSVTIQSGAQLIVGQNVTVGSVQNYVQVQQGGTLTVGAGATIKFAKGNTYLLVNGGTLNLNGAAAQPILLTSAASTATPGDWLGVSLQANASTPASGAFNYVTVSYSGEGVCCLSTKSAILIRDAGTNPTLSNVTVDHSYGNGVEVYNGANPILTNLTLTNNGITGSGQGAAVLYDSAPNDFSQVSGLSATGNLQNAVAVGSGAISGVTAWGNVGLPYSVFGSLNLVTGAQLTLSDGITLLQLSSATIQNGAQLIVGQNVTIANVQNYLSVQQGGTLTVGAGATIKIAKGNTYILVSGGTLNLNGTAAQPIVLTSAAASPASGDWLGVSLQANGATPSNGTFTYATVSYSGEGVCCLSTKSAILIRDPGTNPTLDHVTVDRSYGNGVEVYNGANPTLSNLTLTNNGITGSGQGAAVLYDSAPNDFSTVSNLSATGNLQNALAIGSGAISGVGSWGNVGLPYSVGSLNLLSGAQLALANGLTFLQFSSITTQSGSQLNIGQNTTIGVVLSTIQVQQGSTLNVGSGTTIKIAKGNTYVLVNGGTLNLNGTASHPILITSAAASPAPGDWLGVSMQANGATPASGSLSYVTVAYSGEGVCCLSSKSAILIRDTGTNPTLDHVTVDHSYGNGVEVYNSANPTLSNLSLTSNGMTGSGQGAAVLYDFLPSDLTHVSNLSAAGNLQNALALPGGALNGIGTWPNVGLPIQLPALTLNTGANLTIGTGARLSITNGNLTVASGATMTAQGANTVAFAPGAFGLWVNNGATTTLAGSPTSPITLTSASGAPVPGNWQGVVLASGSTATLNFVTVSYAGRTLTYNSASYTTGLLVASSSATLSYPSIASSAGNDVEVVGGVQPSLRFGSYGLVPAGKYGVANDGWVSGQPLLDASYSWWGQPTGPTAADNPGGTGTPVSSGVLYLPWVGKIPGPVLSLSASSGGAGAQVTLNGSGFDRREMVDVYVGSHLVGSTQVQFDLSIINVPKGRISTPMTIPSLSPGIYVVQVIGRTSGRMALTTYTIT